MLVDFFVADGKVPENKLTRDVMVVSARIQI